MKKILLASISLALTIGFYACKKSSDVSSNPQTQNGLKASKTSGIEGSEPVSFALNTSRSATNTVTWKVIPTVGVSKAIHNSKATFKFSNPGKFMVMAFDGFTTDTVLINVDSIPYTGTDTTTYQTKDSSYYGSPTLVTAPVLANDQLTITPSFLGDTSTSNYDSILIQLSAASVQKYPSSSPIFNIEGSWGNSGPVYNYTGVNWDNSTSTITSPSVATGSTYLSLSANYSFPFSIVYNNVTYTGSVKVVGKTATFTWPYTSGVVISPLVINR